MDNALTLINAELAKAGQDAAELALLARLENRRITPDKEIPPMQFLFQMFCKPCFPRGELVAVAGKAKSGKTFISSILMSLCFRQEVLTVRRLDEDQLRVLWFDTEQSEESTQDILNHRILPMINDVNENVNDNRDTAFPMEKFHIFNVRADFWQERLPLLEAAMHRFSPDLVILDGIRDLVNDINDGVMAQDVIERLMHLASELHCCLVCILHQNKGTEDKNLRGWIGTELKNKAFEVYECTKDADRIFTWSQTDTRKYDIVDKLRYTVGEDGIPQLCSVEQLLAAQEDGTLPNETLESRALFTEKYVIGRKGKFVTLDIKTLFMDAFRPGEIKSAVALQQTVMKLANITSYKFYNYRREEALSLGIIEHRRDQHGCVVYECPAKRSLPCADTCSDQPQPDLFTTSPTTNPEKSPDEPPF